MLSKVIYLSIIKPLFKNKSLIFSSILWLAVLEKHTFIFPLLTSKGIALFLLAISIGKYSGIFILISEALSNIGFSPNISAIAAISFDGLPICNSYNISPIFFEGCSFWYSNALFISSSPTIPLFTSSIPIGCVLLLSILIISFPRLNFNY